MTAPATAFTDDQYANPYPPGIEDHYWHHARNRILVRKLRPALQPGDKVLDIGCGPGIVVDHLRRAGIDCAGVDPGSPRPATEAVAPALMLGASAFDLPAAVRDGFQVLLLMDVLEHLPEPLDFLRDCQRQFPNATRVFITLPARAEIWSSYDEYYGHFRRYTLESLGDLLEPTDLRGVRSGYFFHGLYAVARVAGLWSKQRSHRVSAPRPLFAHHAMARLLDLEEAMLPARLPGSSLYALCRRR